MKSSLLPIFYLLLGAIASGGCGSSKETVASRGMQNLTAKYNIIYNTKLLLDENQRQIEEAYIEDYSQLLPVYQEPRAGTTDLQNAALPDSAIKKADVIVNEKNQSSYVDDAYFLIARANYLKGSFFNASEFFSYVYDNYPAEKELRQASLVMKARALLLLDNREEAGITLDTAFKYIENSPKDAAGVYATRAQLFISSGKEAEAITMLQKALDQKVSKKDKIRWSYLLAQLQERNGRHNEAFVNYGKVVRSNAPFEMAFNAELNRIRIEDEQSGRNIDRIARLKSLLKDDKNRNFIDQIYYRIGDLYLEQREQTQAITNYRTAIKLSTTNQNQKGLSYLRIADIYFRNGDYVSAKAYYDSTLSVLSPSYPGFDLIKRKGENLELLASRYSIISREDTLQILARLPESEREERIGALVREHQQKAAQPAVNNQAPGPLTAGIDRPSLSLNEGKFYFNNSTAISQGLFDFKKRWGNRRLEDNWRRSSKTSSESLVSRSESQDLPSGNQGTGNLSAVTADAIRNKYLSDLPVTPESLQGSNQRIADAYYDIATFYRDELQDNAEAIQTFEELLKRAPESTYKLPVYYNLYRLYADRDQAKSNQYRDILLKQYPESPFARVIADPEYNKRNNARDAALTDLYNQVYDLYTLKEYNEVIKLSKDTELKFGRTYLSPQIAYLNTLATGHLQKLEPFEASLKQIAETYPEDLLVTPLVKQHLQYINSYRELFSSRPTALTDYNPEEPVFVEPAPQPAVPVKQNTQVIAAQPQDTKTVPPAQNNEVKPATTTTEPVVETQQEPVPVTQPETPVKQPETTAPSTPKAPSMYSLPAQGEYYFIVNVFSPGTNLSSSRFGIGQFNRTKFSGAAIKHQLKDAGNDNQLIMVGPFNNLEESRNYERSILPLIRDIMKVPAEKYNTFVITKQELDKLNNSTQIAAYLEFYKNSR